MNEKKIFIIGERRVVTLKVWKSNATEFSVNNANWELSNSSGVESHGVCQVESDNGAFLLSCEVQPEKIGTYKLTYSFNVGTEIVKRNVSIEVKP